MDAGAARTEAARVLRGVDPRSTVMADLPEAVVACRAVLREGCSLRAVLRPGVPDSDSAERPAARTAAATGPGGADAVDFYHDGLVPFPVPDRSPVALEGR